MYKFTYNVTAFNATRSLQGCNKVVSFHNVVIIFSMLICYICDIFVDTVIAGAHNEKTHLLLGVGIVNAFN